MNSRLILLASLVTVALTALAPVNSAAIVVTIPDAATGDSSSFHPMGIYKPIDVAGTVLGDSGAAGKPTGGSNLVYGGGAIQKSTMQYICYWGWTSDPLGEKARFEGFLNGVGGSQWMSVDNQYYSNAQGNILNPTGILKGTWADATSVPTSPSQTDVNNAGIRCKDHFGYNADANYIVATPSGHSQSGFATQWCAYHEGLSSSSGSVSVTYLPYISDGGASCGANFVNANGALDGVTIVGGHEVLEAQSDPKPCTGWCDRSGSENADKCAWNAASANIALPTGSYPVQPIWSNKISGCSMNG